MRPPLKMHFLGPLFVGLMGVSVAGCFSFAGSFWPWSFCEGSRFGKVSGFIGDSGFRQEFPRFRDGRLMLRQESLMSKRSESDVESKISDFQRESSRFPDSTGFETSPESSNARF